jgi:3-phosphoshikimate 1-carboxyvinyltransferase
MAEGASQVEGLLDSLDVRSSLKAIEALGAEVSLHAEQSGLAGTITGWAQGDRGTGDRGTVHLSQEPLDKGAVPLPREPLVIDCGNSGTTARLLLGVLAGYPRKVILEGDASLSKRPMQRVNKPLSLMGAVIAPPDQRCVSCGQALDTLPLIVCGKEQLRAIDYTSPEASAQVKSAVLLAGLHAEGTTSVTEPYKSRDHTELLLPAFGAAVEVDGLTVRIQGGQHLRAAGCAVPGDPSSAAFLLVAAALIPGSEVTCTEVLLNPTRTGFLAVMQRMGATLSLSATAHSGLGAEQVGSVTCSYSSTLTATTIEAQEIPTLIDEIPILALLAAAASGTTVFRQVGELRVKESDRLAAIIEGLDTLGCRAYADGDDLFVVGSATLPERKVLPQDGRTKDAHPLLQTRGDHRLAMTWAIAARALDLDLEIQGIESAAVSYPNFLEDLKGLS